MSDKRWTIDTPEDYFFIKDVYNSIFPHNSLFGMDEILKFIDDNPNAEKVNSHIMRNEGYAKSLKEDKCLKLRKHT